jgi:hypothetical protein
MSCSRQDQAATRSASDSATFAQQRPTDAEFRLPLGASFGQEEQKGLHYDKINRDSYAAH